MNDKEKEEIKQLALYFYKGLINVNIRKITKKQYEPLTLAQLSMNIARSFYSEYRKFSKNEDARKAVKEFNVDLFEEEEVLHIPGVFLPPDNRTEDKAYEEEYDAVRVPVPQVLGEERIEIEKQERERGEVHKTDREYLGRPPRYRERDEK